MTQLTTQRTQNPLHTRIRRSRTYNSLNTRETHPRISDRHADENPEGGYQAQVYNWSNRKTTSKKKDITNLSLKVSGLIGTKISMNKRRHLSPFNERKPAGQERRLVLFDRKQKPASERLAAAGQTEACQGRDHREFQEGNQQNGLSDEEEQVAHKQQARVASEQGRV